jgi:hypothetical protein
MGKVVITEFSSKNIPLYTGSEDENIIRDKALNLLVDRFESTMGLDALTIAIAGIIDSISSPVYGYSGGVLSCFNVGIAESVVGAYFVSLADNVPNTMVVHLFAIPEFLEGKGFGSAMFGEMCIRFPGYSFKLNAEPRSVGFWLKLGFEKVSNADDGSSIMHFGDGKYKALNSTYTVNVLAATYWETHAVMHSC